MKNHRICLVPALLLSGVLLFPAGVRAQTEPKVQTDNPAPQGSGNVSVAATPADTPKETNPRTEFSKLGGAVASPGVPPAKEGETLLRASAPLTGGKDSILAHLYKRNNVLYLDLLTAKGKQAWTRRNTIRLLTPYPDRPGDLTLTWRYLEPRKRSGLMLVASSESSHYVFTFRKGVGGPVTQQQFLNTAKNGTQSEYEFGGLDGRGYAIIRANVVNAGETATGPVQQYFVWNGSKFIPRAKN
jgi:hypothetical protein